MVVDWIAITQALKFKHSAFSAVLSRNDKNAENKKQMNTLSLIMAIALSWLFLVPNNNSNNHQNQPTSTMTMYNGDGNNDGKQQKNVLGTPLEVCCTSPMTGFYRNGSCQSGCRDFGAHVVCARMTQEFLDYTKSRGNDLCTPHPEFNFPGLKPGDKWCLCAVRWREAMRAGYAPPIVLESTNEIALEYMSLEELKAYAETSN